MLSLGLSSGKVRPKSIAMAAIAPVRQFVTSRPASDKVQRDKPGLDKSHVSKDGGSPWETADSIRTSPTSSAGWSVLETRYPGEARFFLTSSKWLSEMMSSFLNEVDLTLLSAFLTHEDFRHAGVCKWIKADGTIVNPSFIDEFQRWFGVLGNTKRWVDDHMVSAFSWGRH